MPLLTLQEIEDMIPVFRGKWGNSFARGLMKILSIDRINDLYDRNCSHSGTDFAAAILEDIGVYYSISNISVLEKLKGGPFITVSNHPYGSIDGIALADFFGHRFPGYKLIVNRFLARIKALDPCFIKVTPTGNEKSLPTKDSIEGIKQAIAHVRAGNPLGIFPSGAVSDLSLRDGCVRDRQWQEPIIRLIAKLAVPVLPVKFLDRNSDFYYSLGLIDWRVRLLRLPSEVFNKRGRIMRIALGEPIMPERQKEIPDIAAFGAFLRKSVYDLR